MGPFLLALGLLAAPASAADRCGVPLPRGPEVPAPLVLSTDCGWYRVETDGDVSRLPANWYATHKQPWAPPDGLSVRRTRAGRYLVLRAGRVVWRSTGLYFNEAGSLAFGPDAFAFDSYGRRGVFLTDLRGQERLVLRGRGFYPIDFTSERELLIAGPRTITVISPAGTVTRRFRYRRSSSYQFDEQTETLYFVSPRGILSAAHGSSVRAIRKVHARGWIGLLGRRLLTFTGRRHLVVLRRDSGSLVAHATWNGARRELDALDVSDDGRLFAFRVSKARPGERRGNATVYVLRAGEGQAHAVLRHGFGPVGCGSTASLSWNGSFVLYHSTDSPGVAQAALLAASGLVTRLTPLMRGLPRIVPATPGNAFWASEFRE